LEHETSAHANSMEAEEELLALFESSCPISLNNQLKIYLLKICMLSNTESVLGYHVNLSNDLSYNECFAHDGSPNVVLPNLT